MLDDIYLTLPSSGVKNRCTRLLKKNKEYNDINEDKQGHREVGGESGEGSTDPELLANSQQENQIQT